MIELSLNSSVKNNEEVFEGENKVYSFNVGFEKVGGNYDYYSNKKIALVYKLPSGRIRIQEEDISLIGGSMTIDMARYLLTEDGVLGVQVVVFDDIDPDTQEELTLIDVVNKYYENDTDDDSNYNILKSKVYEFHINNSIDPIIDIIDSESGQVYPDVLTYLSRYFAKSSDLARVAFTGDYNDLRNVPSGGGGDPITIDDELSGTSTNPVQNKVIKTALDSKVEAQYRQVFQIDQTISVTPDDTVFKTPVLQGSRYPLDGYLVNYKTPSVYSDNFLWYLQTGTAFRLDIGSLSIPLVRVAEVVNYGTPAEVWYYFITTPNVTKISFNASATPGMTWEVSGQTERAFVMRMNPDRSWLIATRLINPSTIGTSLKIYAKEKYIPSIDAVVVDSELSSSSTNPVQNKVIKAALDTKAEKQFTNLLYAANETFEAVPSGNGVLYDGASLIDPQYYDITNTDFDLTDLLSALEDGKPVKFNNEFLDVVTKYDDGNVSAYQLLYNLEAVDDLEFKRLDATKDAFLMQVAYAQMTSRWLMQVFSTVSGEYDLEIFGEGVSSVVISTNIEADANSDDKAASPKAVKTYVDGAIPVADSALSSSSENPVQNKVILTALDAKSDVGHTHNTSKLFNDERFISNPRTVRFNFTTGAGQQTPSGYVGGTDAYMYFGEISASDAADVLAAAQLQVPVYVNGLPMTLDYDNGEATLFYNIKPTETGSASGFDIDDPTKPGLVINVSPEDDPQITSGYTVIVFYTEPFTSLDITGYTEGSYLTSHQSLSNYYTKSEVDSAISTAISGAIGGSY